MQNHKKVIPFPSSGWRFFDYADEIEDWYQGLSEEGRDTFDTLLKTNSKATIPLQWSGCKMLKGKCKKEGIWEWRFFADDCQQRLLGIFEGHRTAIFLIGCSHKQTVYKPPDCLDTAIKRAREVRDGQAKLSKREVRSDL
ncbi:MAG TPA: hypothetical protein VKF63_06570 [Terracidiphilus sp.]|nr:hypothetical protein [Terracidiphilus sp.]